MLQSNIANNGWELFQVHIFHNESFNLYALIILVLTKMCSIFNHVYFF